MAEKVPARILFTMRGIGPEAGEAAMKRFMADLKIPTEDGESLVFYISLKVRRRRKREAKRGPDSLALPLKQHPNESA